MAKHIGTDNLKPCKNTKEAKERGAKGGVASGEARRKQKTFRELARIMLNTKTTEKNAEILAKYGISPDDADLKTFIFYSGILQKAMQGNVWAIEKVIEFLGEKEADKLNISTNDVTIKISKKKEEDE